MTPEEYVKIKKQVEDNIKRLAHVLRDAYESVQQHPFPENVRPATAQDIVVDQVVWYRLDTPHWLIVDKVLNHGDRFKAFVSNGSRYGLDGAFVEVD